jgi:DNA-binding NarL/FixJ family response regulator
MNTEIVIIDHHLLFSQVMQLCLEQYGMSVLACPRTGEEGLSVCQELQPNVAVISLDLPDTDGIKVGQSVLEHCDDTRLVLATKYTSARAARHASRAGFAASVPKATISLPQFVRLIETVVDGNDRIPHESRQVPHNNWSNENRDIALLVNQLTAREFAVIHLLTRGMDNRDIAAQLRISPNTVRGHIQGILTKLQVHSRLEAVTFAVGHGIVERGRYLDAI